MDSTELVPTVAPVSNLDLSGFDSDQLDEKISSLVADFAKSNTDGLDAVLPYIREMQQVLSQRGSARNKSDINIQRLAHRRDQALEGLRRLTKLWQFPAEPSTGGLQKWRGLCPQKH